MPRHPSAPIGLAILAIGIALAWCAAVDSLAQSPPSAAPSSPAPAAAERAPLTIVITGANRGLGLEFARQYHARGDRVIATARKPDDAEALKALGVRVVGLDVTDANSVRALAAGLAQESIDLLINNAGVANRARSIKDIDFDGVTRVLAVNAIGPMRVTQALLPQLEKGRRKTIVSISSGLGSIANNERGGNYGYRESKAALNMFVRSLAAELEPAGFTCIAMSPGWVRTDMGGKQAPLEPKDSIAGMIEVIDHLKSDDTGRFYEYTGKQLPW